MKYKWIDNYTGEIKHNLWEIICDDVWYFFYAIRHKQCPFIPRKWKYNRKGW